MLLLGSVASDPHPYISALKRIQTTKRLVIILGGPGEYFVVLRSNAEWFKSRPGGLTSSSVIAGEVVDSLIIGEIPADSPKMAS